MRVAGCCLTLVALLSAMGAVVADDGSALRLELEMTIQRLILSLLVREEQQRCKGRMRRLKVDLPSVPLL